MKQMMFTDTIKNWKKTLSKLFMDNKHFVWTKHESLLVKKLPFIDIVKKSGLLML